MSDTKTVYDGMDMFEITGFNDARLDVYARLSETQLFHYYEPDEGLFVAESPKVISRALLAGYEPVSMLIEKKELEQNLGELQHEMGDRTAILQSVPVYVADTETLHHLPGYSLIRGMLCAFRRKKRQSVEKMLDKIGVTGRLAVLESVVNPTNVGAIFRSAAAMGMDAVIVTSDSSDPLYRRAARVSMGTVFQIPWTYINIDDWAENGIETLHRHGFSVVTMALRDDAIPINDPALKAANRLAVVLGSEGPGLREETIVESDYKAIIPMLNGVDSLNVAAASAVAFWELRKR